MIFKYFNIYIVKEKLKGNAIQTNKFSKCPSNRLFLSPTHSTNAKVLLETGNISPSPGPRLAQALCCFLRFKTFFSFLYYLFSFSI